MPGVEGKVALVTGPGGMCGVGRATALKLADSGAPPPKSMTTGPHPENRKRRHR